jgi:cytochrome c oxidase subunit IV
MKAYWITWAVLLAFTVTMLWADGAAIPRLAFVLFMIAAMLAKASIIGANFMHLRSERLALVLTVVVGLLVTGAVLFALIAPDALRIHEMVRAAQSR